MISRTQLEALCFDDDMTERLDDLVHDAKAQEAAAINNGGPDEQLSYLLTVLTPDELKRELAPTASQH